MTTGKAHLSWGSIRISVAPAAAGAVEFAFNELGSLGTEINHLRKTESDTVVVIGYFDALPDEEFVRFELGEALRIYEMPMELIYSIENRTVADTDWLAEWKRHWKPVEIGTFIIAPPWEEVNTVEKIVIEIEPNMAFGTGTHETTQLCLTAIEENYKPGQSFLDVGTGTGILSIAAAKINSKFQISDFRFSGCDTDGDSIAIAKDNALLNGVGEQIEFYIGSISDATPQFDFVCANLTIDVILRILSLLIGKTKEMLVLSGILFEQEESIISELSKQNIEDYKIQRAGEWISVTLPRSKTKKPTRSRRRF